MDCDGGRKIENVSCRYIHPLSRLPTIATLPPFANQDQRLLQRQITRILTPLPTYAIYQAIRPFDVAIVSEPKNELYRYQIAALRAADHVPAMNQVMPSTAARHPLSTVSRSAPMSRKEKRSAYMADLAVRAADARDAAKRRKQAHEALRDADTVPNPGDAEPSPAFTPANSHVQELGVDVRVHSAVKSLADDWERCRRPRMRPLQNLPMSPCPRGRMFKISPQDACSTLR